VQSRSLLFAIVLTLLLAVRAHATMMVKPMTLDEVTAESQHVMHAIVTNVVSGRDEAGVPSTWTTLDVVETLKGTPDRTVTIKQYGVATPLADGTLTRVAGMPMYEVGEEVVLFLRGASRSGFTSPVGLGQGSYRVRRHGPKPEVRGDDPREGRQELDTFVDRVRSRLREHQER
jgi:hypothetical protein